MAGIREWWHSMPRSTQLLVAVVSFWLLYAFLAVYELAMPGQLDPQTAMAAAPGWTEPAGDPTLAVQAPERVLTTGDLVVLLALAFIVAVLSATFIVARREIRGPTRQPGMGAFDDPLWSSGELEPLPAGRSET